MHPQPRLASSGPRVLDYCRPECCNDNVPQAESRTNRSAALAACSVGVGLALLTGCALNPPAPNGGEPARAIPSPSLTASPTITVPNPKAHAAASPIITPRPSAVAGGRPPASKPTEPGVVTVQYRLERHTTDEATANFETVVEATLTDPRGWSRAGFVLVRKPDAPFKIVLTEGPEVDQLCLPYQTYGKYSCQNGPVVAVNADRWRGAHKKWTGDLSTYRQMLINHEVGHLLGQKHPAVQCPRGGALAPVMAQQTTELNGCRPNPWPLPHEIARAARHDLPLAPPFER